MSIFKDIVTAVRGGVNEVGEAIVDKNAVRIFEQSIRDEEAAISKAKIELRNLKAREHNLKLKAEELARDAADYLAAAQKAKDTGNEELMLKNAERVQQIRGEKTDMDSQFETLQEQVNKILAVIKQREKQIEKNRTELQKAKTVEELNKTTAAMAAAMPTNDNSAKRLKRAQERVQKRHSDFEAKLAADEWLNDSLTGDDLDKLNAEAGITGDKSVQSVLDELK